MVENEWWVTEYGDPCRECGFVWSQSPESAIALAEAVPGRLAGLLDGRWGDEAFPGATWSAKAYVFHVADNLRIFAERLEGVAAGASTTLASYDQDELAAARRYEQMSVESALWSVRTATTEWASATRDALSRHTEFLHEERGPLTAAEVTRGPAHDAVHHCLDVARATGAVTPPGA
ncbi:MAG: hypothetical protein QOF40_1587 [Actinomycetota bacterium]|jgi:hypothetical protein|nr:hypothetical protein [Actinomycetota bacterium]